MLEINRDPVAGEAREEMLREAAEADLEELAKLAMAPAQDAAAAPKGEDGLDDR